MGNRKKQIDIAKLICACQVLFLHTINLTRLESTGIVKLIDDLMYRLIWVVNPVEFFFITSAFFLFSKPLSWNRLKKNLFRLVALYAFWSLFYLDNIVNIFLSNGLLVAFVKAFRLIFFIGTGGHMWYVLALIYALLLLYPLLMKRKEWLAFSISIIFYMINLLGDSYYCAIEGFPHLKSLIDFLNSALGSMYLFRGWIFVMLGFFLAVHKERKYFWGSFFIFVFFGILNNAELSFIKDRGMGLQYSITVMKPIASFMMCYWLTFDKFSIKENTAFLAKLSTVLYFSHIYIRKILYNYIADMHVVYLIILLLCMAITKFLEMISKRKQMSWVNNVL